MKIKLPTSRRLLTDMKRAFYLVIPVVAIAWFITMQDPNIELTKNFLSGNDTIIDKVGNVTDISLFQAIYVDDAIDINDNFSHGYNIYRYKIKGKKDSILVNIRADKSEQGIRNVFSIRKIESY